MQSLVISVPPNLPYLSAHLSNHRGTSNFAISASPLTESWILILAIVIKPLADPETIFFVTGWSSFSHGHPLRLVVVVVAAAVYVAADGDGRLP